jgi:hypothetical protein
MDLVKIAGVADRPMPSNKKEVQSFIGFINFTNNSSLGSLTMCAHSLT